MDTNNEIIIMMCFQCKHCLIMLIALINSLTLQLLRQYTKGRPALDFNNIYRNDLCMIRSLYIQSNGHFILRQKCFLITYLYYYKMMKFVCVSVCLYRIDSKTTGGFSMKIGIHIGKCHRSNIGLVRF